MKRYPLIALITLLFALVIGYFVSTQVSAFLGISINPKTWPEVETPVARPPASSATEIEPFEAILLPYAKLEDDRYGFAARELADAAEYRTGYRPEIFDRQFAAPDGRLIRVELPDPAALEPESYRIRSQGPDGSLALQAGDTLGAVYGMYALAAQLKAGSEELAGVDVDMTVTPEMPYRFVDIGGVGIVPDEALWRAHDYSHHLRAFESVILAEAPYIDEAEMARANQQFREYVQRMIAFGYNGIIFDGFLEYVNFDKVGDGYEVYGPESANRLRHAALRDAIGEMLKYAGDMGLQVIMKSDMLTFSDPLAANFDEALGGVDTADMQDLTERWIRLTLSNDPETVHNLAQVAYLSRDAMLKGLFIGEFAQSQILAMGLEPTPQFWLFEWDIVSGSSSALSAVYQPVTGNPTPRRHHTPIPS